MSTQPFRRLVAPIAEDPILKRIGVKPFFIALSLFDRGQLTAAQIKALFQLDDEDLSGGGQVGQLKARLDAATSAKAKTIATLEVVDLAILAQYDSANTLGLHDPATFASRVDDIVATANARFS